MMLALRDFRPVAHRASVAELDVAQKDKFKSALRLAYLDGSPDGPRATGCDAPSATRSHRRSKSGRSSSLDQAKIARLAAFRALRCGRVISSGNSREADRSSRRRRSAVDTAGRSSSRATTAAVRNSCSAAGRNQSHHCRIGTAPIDHIQQHQRRPTRLFRAIPLSAPLLA